jgi:cell pole-organizing protein PopZ
MEEILASIRRIISEDDAPAEGEATTEAAPAAAAPAAPEALPDLDIPAELPPMAVADAAGGLDDDLAGDDVLELTERVDEPEEDAFEAAEEPLQISDLEVMAPPAASARANVPDFDLPDMDDDEPLVGDSAARSAASAFDALERGILMPPSGRTLEDVVREMLRPMMKAWLDENLPSIVQAQVAAEVDRISRQRRG